MGAFKKSGSFGGKRGGGFRQDGGRSAFGGKQSFGGGCPSFGGRPKFSRNDREGGDREMFRATCATCQKSCEVPFRPSGEKPVYCSDCFGSQKSASTDRPRREDRGGRDRFPRNDRSSFGKREFAPAVVAPDRRIDDLKKQIDGLSIKMDRVLTLLSKISPSQEAPKKREKKKVDEAGVKDAIQAMIANDKKTTKKTKKSTKKTVKKAPKEKRIKKDKSA